MEIGKEDKRMNWTFLIEQLLSGKSLTKIEAEEAMQTVLSGGATDAQLAAMLVALRSKGSAVSELSGFADSLRSAAASIEIPDSAIDIVGTGGSIHGAKHALNISTMASFVVAAAGVPVCKHGNKKASSTSGSFDFLEALGINIEISAERVSQAVEEIGLGFVYAKSFHPAMKYAGPVRKELGIPTIFNLLGPLAHPGDVKRLVLGTPQLENAKKLAEVLYERSVAKAWVVTGADGLDELTLTGPSTIVEVTDSGIATFTFSPSEIGLSLVSSVDKIPGGTPKENCEIFLGILEGDKGPQRDIILLNAAAGFVVAEHAADIAEGFELASRTVEGDKISELVEKYRFFSQQ